LRSLKPNELLGLIGGLYVAGGVVVALGLLIPGTASRLLLAVGLGMSLYALFEFHGWLVDQGATGSVGVIRLMVAGIVAQAAAAGTLIVAAGVGSGTIAPRGCGRWGWQSWRPVSECCVETPTKATAILAVVRSRSQVY
jgi:hypothetical protein